MKPAFGWHYSQNWRKGDKKMNRIFCIVVLAVVLLTACQPTAATTPKIGDELTAENGLTVTVIKFATLTESFFLTQSGHEKHTPSSDNTYYAVAIKVELKRGTLTMELNLDNIVLISENGNKIPSTALSMSDKAVDNLSEWAYSYAGEENNILDFGIGFPEAESSIQQNFSPDGKVSLVKYHVSSPTWLIFLFEAPVSSKAMWFQFNDLPKVLLTE
jgi:hypothetical protein